jgi:hypothetical protein
VKGWLIVLMMNSKLVMVIPDGSQIKTLEVKFVARPICMDLIPDGTTVYICTLPQKGSGPSEILILELKDALRKRQLQFPVL